MSYYLNVGLRHCQFCNKNKNVMVYFRDGGIRDASSYICLGCLKQNDAKAFPPTMFSAPVWLFKLADKIDRTILSYYQKEGRNVPNGQNFSVGVYNEDISGVRYRDEMGGSDDCLIHEIDSKGNVTKLYKLTRDKFRVLMWYLENRSDYYKYLYSKGGVGHIPVICHYCKSVTNYSGGGVTLTGEQGVKYTCLNVECNKPMYMWSGLHSRKITS